MSFVSRALCDRRLSWHRPRPAYKELQRVADYCRQLRADADIYGEGAFLAAFEREVSECLGQAGAWFLPSGTQAQQIALRTWAEERQCSELALSPFSHLELKEQRAYYHLSGLSPVYVPVEPRPLTLDDLERMERQVGTLVLELPLRALGGVLPSWSELERIKHWAQKTNTRLHLDGARLWEVAFHYQRTLLEICQGFDSVYVSFYKALGSTSGALLAGSQHFLSLAAPWKVRYGGRLVELHPLVVAAKLHFDEQRPKLSQYHVRAAAIARALSGVNGLKLIPESPHINMFHVYFSASIEQMEAARDRIAREDRVWLCSFFAAPLFAGAPGECYTEIVVASAAEDLTDVEICHLFDKLVTLANVS